MLHVSPMTDIACAMGQGTVSISLQRIRPLPISCAARVFAAIDPFGEAREG